jgi:uncharacterized protein
MITIDYARTLYPANADSAHDFDHVLRVMQLADKIAQAEGADRDIVRVAALLHDIGLDQGRAGHEAAAALRAREILSNLATGESADENHDDQPAHIRRNAPAPGGPPTHSVGYGLGRQASQGFIEAVAHAIEAHRFRSGPAPRTLEAQVLFDADKLDSIGAIGIARAFAFGGWRGQKLWADVPPDYVDRMDGSEADPRRHTPVHEYVVKLSKIKDRMQTATGRTIAEGRHAFMAAFYEQLDREAKGAA